jgi:hypothetical protein
MYDKHHLSFVISSFTSYLNISDNLITLEYLIPLEPAEYLSPKTPLLNILIHLNSAVLSQEAREFIIQRIFTENILLSKSSFLSLLLFSNREFLIDLILHPMNVNNIAETVFSIPLSHNIRFEISSILLQRFRDNPNLLDKIENSYQDLLYRLISENRFFIELLHIIEVNNKPQFERIVSKKLIALSGISFAELIASMSKQSDKIVTIDCEHIVRKIINSEAFSFCLSSPYFLNQLLEALLLKDFDNPHIFKHLVETAFKEYQKNYQLGEHTTPAEKQNYTEIQEHFDKLFEKIRAQENLSSTRFQGSIFNNAASHLTSNKITNNMNNS